MPFVAVRIFLEQPFEAPRQHLFHHAEIIAGGQVIALDVELAVLVFHEPVRPRHDHRADGIGALNVAVVIDLDPLRRRVQVKRLGQPFQQLGLRRRFGHLARQAFAGVAQRAVDQFGLFAALRHQQFDLAAQLVGQRRLPSDQRSRSRCDRISCRGGSLVS